VRIAQTGDRYLAVAIGRSGQSVIRIERTEYFQPKSEDSAAEVDVAPELVAIFRTFKEDLSLSLMVREYAPSSCIDFVSVGMKAASFLSP
jgi:hypothetical protein